MKINVLYFLFALVATQQLTSCASKPEPTEKAQEQARPATPSDQVTLTDAQFRLADIKLGSVQMRRLSNTIKVSGALEVPPKAMVTIAVPMGGFLRSLGLLQGQKVSKGQLLAEIENQEFIDIQNNYLQARSRVKYTEAEYKRQLQLRSEDVNALKTLQQATADFETAKASLAALEERIALAGIDPSFKKTGKISRMARIYSPISGYVRTTHVSTGKYFAPQDVLYELVNREDMHLELGVFEKDINRIHVGQSVRFALASENDFKRQARVFLIGQSTDANRLVSVHCHLIGHEEDVNLLPGMYAKAVIETSSEPVSSVPNEAIVQSAGQDVVFVALPADKGLHRFQMVPVKRGISEGDFTEVKFAQALPADRTLVLDGAYTLLSAIKNAQEVE